MSAKLCRCVFLILAIAAPLLVPPAAWAMPAFARRYNLSCSVCQDAFPRLSACGGEVGDVDWDLPCWGSCSSVRLGAERLGVPERPPGARRMPAYARSPQGEDLSPVTGCAGNDSDSAFQAPHRIK